MESRHCGQDKRIFFFPVHNASTLLAPGFWNKVYLNVHLSLFSYKSSVKFSTKGGGGAALNPPNVWVSYYYDVINHDVPGV